MRPAGLCVYGVNGECMVRGVIGGRSESRPRVPGVRIKVKLVGQLNSQMEVVLLLVGV